MKTQTEREDMGVIVKFQKYIFFYKMNSKIIK